MDRLALLTALGVAMLVAQQVTPPDNPTATADQGSTAPKTPVRPPDPTKPGNSTSPNGQHQQPAVPKPPAS
jgi:hypothetical protein